jgi:ankyrin repeat protein
VRSCAMPHGGRNDRTALLELLDGPNPPHTDSIDLATGRTALMEATMKGYVFVAEALLYRGAQMNLQDVEGNTALYFAVLWGQPYTVELLLSRGANVNAWNGRGMTVLMLAAHWNHMPLVEVLLRWRADVSIAGPDGRTAEDQASDPAIKDTLRVGDRALTAPSWPAVHDP